MKTESINKIINKKSIKKPKLLIENLLPADGITILAGEPKVGKTFLLQQLTYSISVENTFLGRNIEKTKVIYFSTENSAELLKDRLLNLGTNFGNSLYCYQCPMSIDDIKYTLATVKRAKKERVLAIIDTFQEVVYGNQKFNINAYNDTYNLGDIYKELSNEFNTTFILVIHLNKNENNSFKRIMGSTGLRAVTSANITLEKETNTNYVLKVESRYFVNQEINLKKLENGFFDLDTSEILESTNDLDIITITKMLAKSDEKSIEDTSSNLCATFNLKYTTPNCLYKKLENSKKLLEQCNITFKKRRSNGKNLIKIELLENDEEISPTLKASTD